MLPRPAILQYLRILFSANSITAWETWCRSIDMPTTLTELGIYPTDAQIEEMAEKCVFGRNGHIGFFQPLTQKKILWQSCKWRNNTSSDSETQHRKKSIHFLTGFVISEHLRATAFARVGYKLFSTSRMRGTSRSVRRGWLQLPECTPCRYICARLARHTPCLRGIPGFATQNFPAGYRCIQTYL